jgi:hypothetical protein
MRHGWPSRRRASAAPSKLADSASTLCSSRRPRSRWHAVRRLLSPAKLAAAGVVPVAALASPASADPLTISRGFFTVGGTFGVDLVFYTPDIRPDAPARFVGEGNGRAGRGLEPRFRAMNHNS